MNKRVKLHAKNVLLFSLTLISHWVVADEQTDLAKKLDNPVAALISVPIEINIDNDIGPNENGTLTVIKVQPVIPLSLNDQWNLISRTIVPIIDQDDIPTDGLGESGVGDVLQSVFFSPKEPTANGWIWGLGPAILLDTASDDALGLGQWGLGPTAVLLKQANGWTYGALSNHIWDIAGDENREDVSNTFLQPFLSYTTSKTKTSFSFNVEASYDWQAEQSNSVANFSIGQLFKAGAQIMQVRLGARYWLESTDNGPEGWGAIFRLTFLFPK